MSNDTLASNESLSITAEAYHQLPGVSNSKLSVFIDDPREYYYQFLSGKYVAKQKDHFDFGTAVHDICLLGIDNVCVIPSSVLASNGAKSGNAWKAFRDANADKLLMKQADYDSVMRCVDAVKAHPIAGDLLSSPGYTERCYAWENQDLGFALRSRPDKLCQWRGMNIVVDLKTTTDTTAGAFVKSIANFGYARQEAFYRKVLEANGVQVDAFVFVAVKDSMPHCVDCYTVAPEWLALAQEEVDEALNELSVRTRDNDWTTATFNSVVQLAPPGYLRFKKDYAL